MTQSPNKNLPNLRQLGIVIVFVHSIVALNELAAQQLDIGVDQHVRHHNIIALVLLLVVDHGIALSSAYNYAVDQFEIKGVVGSLINFVAQLPEKPDVSFHQVAGSVPTFVEDIDQEDYEYSCDRGCIKHLQFLCQHSQNNTILQAASKTSFTGLMMSFNNYIYSQNIIDQNQVKMKLVHYFLLFSLTISTQQLSFRGRESAHLQKKVKTRTEIQQVLRKSGVAIIFFASVQCKTCASAFQELALQAMIQNIPLLTTSNSFLQARELFQLYRVEEFPTILVLKDTPQKVIFAATGYSSSAINQAAEVAVKNRR